MQLHVEPDWVVLSERRSVRTPLATRKDDFRQNRTGGRIVQAPYTEHTMLTLPRYAHWTVTYHKEFLCRRSLTSETCMQIPGLYKLRHIGTHTLTTSAVRSIMIAAVSSHRVSSIL